MRKRPLEESLSVSQLKSYYPEHGGCRFGWKLKKRDKVRQTPAAWFPQGTAVHHAWEAWEKSDRLMSVDECEEVFGEKYDEEVNRLCGETPNLDHWFSSGRYYPAILDIPRRYDKGMDQVRTWIEFYSSTEERPIRIDGVPAAEVPFELQLDPGVKIRGYIDAVFPDDVVDGKTGNNPPKGSDGQEDATQLGVYRVALAETQGVTVDRGYYFMAQKGKPSQEHDLKGWTLDRVTDMFGQLAADIDAEKFEPSPEPNKCRTCTVQHACPFVAL